MKLHHIKKQYTGEQQQEIHTLVEFDREQNTWIQLYEIYAFDTGHGQRTDLTHILDEDWVNSIDWREVFEETIASQEPEVNAERKIEPHRAFLRAFFAGINGRA